MARPFPRSLSRLLACLLIVPGNILSHSWDFCGRHSSLPTDLLVRPASHIHPSLLPTRSLFSFHGCCFSNVFWQSRESFTMRRSVLLLVKGDQFRQFSIVKSACKNYCYIGSFQLSLNGWRGWLLINNFREVDWVKHSKIDCLISGSLNKIV